MEPTMELSSEVRERIVRVEEELKAQRELMKQGFEQNEKRFVDMRSYSTRWFTVMSLMLAAIGVAVTVSTFFG